MFDGSCIAFQDPSRRGGLVCAGSRIAFDRIPDFFPVLVAVVAGSYQFLERGLVEVRCIAIVITRVQGFPEDFELFTDPLFTDFLLRLRVDRSTGGQNAGCDDASAEAVSHY